MELQRNTTNKGPADRFTGDVYIDAVARGHESNQFGALLVHFTPGARTAWHSHSLGQTVYVTEGEGRMQSRGAEVLTIRPGDIVYTPGGEWHWHGAAPDRFMTHLAISEGDSSWGDHVTDAEYSGG